MSFNKQLTQSDRLKLSEMLKERLTFKDIGKILGKDPTTISKEIKKHRLSVSSGAVGRVTNRFIHRSNCKVTYLCSDGRCYYKKCSLCNGVIQSVLIILK